jgi:outer membrane protein assembly factor BamB
VFAHSQSGRLRAYDALTGAIVWTDSLSEANASPTIAGRVLYVGGQNGVLEALDVATGDPLWVTPELTASSSARRPWSTAGGSFRCGPTAR